MTALQTPHPYPYPFPYLFPTARPLRSMPDSLSRLRLDSPASRARVLGLLLRPAIRGHLTPASGRYLTTSPGPRDEALHSTGRRQSLF